MDCLEHQTVKFKIPDYSKMCDFHLLEAFDKFDKKMESVSFKSKMLGFEKVFGIMLNMRYILPEIMKRFELDFDEAESPEDALSELLKKNGINPSKN